MKLLMAIVSVLLTANSLRAEAPKLVTFDTIKSDVIGNQLQAAMIWTGAASNKTGVTVAFRRDV